ncbi:menaquinone-dependent protoporphyrinogen IX dehydrogenase [Robertkochia solimangrovi]|uniref:menaquinone-dependent protoporphyrinogen IX dehydrogenase n=1 Tax=Robertkochia solimangrovi TaxID=2213046 RepID=UPI0011804C7E|nr:menaquinone-dependent protoporphyrinogen IX dehydrogenase [Robertkochia solimangrovi]TRZ46104.1 menaquinone-dependent protoporphyrinogen IX dehydrogenase [Robertkochia solimangrovi]
MKVLIVYGTSEGQTRKIARFMGNILEQKGHSVEICDATMDPPSADDFEAVLIGASIHIGHYQSGVTHYIKKHVTALNKMPGAFFSVCLAIVSTLEEEHKEAVRIANEYLKDTGWNPMLVEHIAGALKYTEYNYFKKLIMKMISKKEGRPTDTSHDFEYTDWDRVMEFLNEFIDKSERYSIKQNVTEIEN